MPLPDSVRVWVQAERRRGAHWVRLADEARPRGLLCFMHARYRVEDSRVADALEPISVSPPLREPLFSPDGLRLHGATARSMFRKQRK